MTTTHRVLQGETLVRIADEYGFFAPTLWNHPANAELKARRGDMNILFPGDEVVIPEPVPKSVSAATGRRYCFRRRGVPMRITIQLLADDVPLANRDYSLVVDGAVELSGVTDANGVLEQWVSTRAATGVLRLGEEYEWPLRIGDMDPIDTLSGVQKRLHNLGYPTPVDGRESPATAAALAAFQRAHGLEVTGSANEETAAKLAEIYDAAMATRG